MPKPLFSFSPLYFTLFRPQKQPARMSFVLPTWRDFADCNYRAGYKPETYSTAACLRFSLRQVVCV